MFKPVKSVISLIVFMVPFICYNQATMPVEANKEDVATIIGHLPGNVRTVAVQGQYAYVGQDTLFGVVDISDETNPIFIGQMDAGALVFDIAVSGSYAYIATQSNMQVIDISDPITPNSVGVYEEQTLVTKTLIKDNLVFVLSRNGLKIYDISTSPALVLAGQDNTYIVEPRDLDLYGDYAFILESTSSFKIRVIDISNFDDLHEVATKSTFDNALAITGNRMITVDSGCSSVCYTYTTVYSWSPDPWEFVYVGESVAVYSESSFEVAANDLYAFVGKDVGLYVFSIYQDEWGIAPPKFITAYNDIEDAWDIVLSEDRIYAASSTGFFIVEAPPITKTFLPIVFTN
ncbi:MAG: hypothetical protein H6662_02960 [Ardenticatenaceae bacterium]|nr:hypothetical protein [Ardenticatenaceae bacterium]MCB8989463.1 hypothetical protein [Ardenticatenaceae bacterium]MCB9004999.1 hypothetical protein [Ardenticatenaceae bacterium]